MVKFLSISKQSTKEANIAADYLNTPLKPKAIALLSGGLDSSLAIRLVLRQGIEIIALNFLTPFCRCNRVKGCKSLVKKITEELGIEFKIIYLGEEYLRILENPRYGYGKNLNPCIDCRILMFKHAKKFMKDRGASFIITGEVLGQRPKSQRRKALKIIEKEASLEGFILRPLSAKLLPPTLPEKKGWVRRESLLDFVGRTRRPQMELADKLGLKDYPCPAGGCLLTDPSFCKRLKDLLKYEKLNLENIELLKIGRHFRINSSFKLIVGRDEEENKKLLESLQPQDLCFKPMQLKGPLGLGRGQYTEDDKILASQIIARYTLGATPINIKISSLGKEEVISTERLADEKINSLRI